MISGQTKIFGNPSKICGLDFLSWAKAGIVIIYDDNSNTITKEAIKILKKETYIKQMGK